MKEEHQSDIIRLVLLIGLGLIFYFLAPPSCEREKDLTSPEPIPAEATRQRVDNSDSVAVAQFVKIAESQSTQIEALRRVVTQLEGQRKQTTEKAAQSAREYAKTPTLPNCHNALTDCQQEAQQAREVVAGQTRMIAGQDSLIGLQRVELDRRAIVKDSLSEGWHKANIENEAMARKLKRQKTVLRIGAGIVSVFAAGLAVK